MKKILLGLLLLVLLLLGFTAALPRLLSTPAGTRWMVNRLNRVVHGHFEIERCSLRWAAPSSFRGVSWSDAEGSGFQVEEMRLAHGLLRAATQRDPGEIFLLRPEVTVNLVSPPPPLPEVAPPPRPVLPRPTPPTPPHPTPPAPPPAPPEPVEPLPWPVLFSGSLKVIEGQATILRDGQRLLALHEVFLDVALTSAEDGLRWQVDLAQADASGTARLTGVIRPGPEMNLKPETLAGEGRVVIKAWDLGPLLAMIELPDGLQAAGRLDTDLGVYTAAGTPLRVQGTARVDQAEVTGGMLTSDRLGAEQVDIQADLAFPLENGYTQRLTCDTGFFRLRIEGRMDEQQRPSAELDIGLDLADLARQIPRTLQLRDGLSIEDGQLRAQLELEPADSGLAIRSEVLLKDLAGRHEERDLALREPFHLTGAMVWEETAWELQALEVQSSFARGAASGTADALDAQLSFDLTALLEEAGQFLDLALWQGAGALELEAGGSNLLGETPRLKALLTGSDLTVKHDGRTWLDGDALRLEAEAVLRGRDGSVTEVSEVQLSYQLPAVEGTLSAGNIPATAAGAAIGSFKVQSTIDLERLAAWLAIETLESMAGRSRVHLAGDLKNDILRLESIRFDTGDLEIKSPQGALRLASLQTTGDGTFALDPGGSFALQTAVTCDFGTASLALRRSDAGSGSVPVEAGIRADVDLAGILAGAAGTPGLPPPGSMAGQLAIRWDLQPDTEGLARHTLEVKAAALEMQHEETLHELGNWVVFVLALYDEDADLVALPEIRLQSPVLAGQAQGSMEKLSQEQVLHLMGILEPRERELEEWMEKFGGERVLLMGLSPLPFEGRLGLGVAFGAALPEALLELSLNLERLEARGSALQEAKLEITTREGLMQGRATATLEGGRLALMPEIALLETPAVLRLPPDSRVLDKVHLTQNLADRLLADRHPLFRGNRVEGGLVSLAFGSFSATGFDNEEELQLDFEGQLELRDVQLAAGGWLNELFELTGIRERTITIQQQDMQIMSKDGRIHGSPLTLGAGSMRLTLQGSVGADGTLDYMIRVPVTQELVGRDAYALLQDATLDLPVRGTIQRPQVDRRELQAAAAALVRQAARRAIERRAGDLLRR